MYVFSKTSPKFQYIVSCIKWSEENIFFLLVIDEK